MDALAITKLTVSSSPDIPDGLPHTEWARLNRCRLAYAAATRPASQYHAIVSGKVHQWRGKAGCYHYRQIGTSGSKYDVSQVLPWLCFSEAAILPLVRREPLTLMVSVDEANFLS